MTNDGGISLGDLARLLDGLNTDRLITIPDEPARLDRTETDGVTHVAMTVTLADGRTAEVEITPTAGVLLGRIDVAEDMQRLDFERPSRHVPTGVRTVTLQLHGQATGRLTVREPEPAADAEANRG